MENVVNYSRWGNEGGGGKYQTAERRRLACSACWQISIPATVKISTLSIKWRIYKPDCCNVKQPKPCSFLNLTSLQMATWKYINFDNIFHPKRFFVIQLGPLTVLSIHQFSPNHLDLLNQILLNLRSNEFFPFIACEQCIPQGVL